MGAWAAGAVLGSLGHALAGEPTPWELRMSVGAEVAARPWGVVEVAARRGPLEIALLTDTLDVRWTPTFGRGKAWVAARGELGAAGLLLARWDDEGQPAPALAQLASYAGVEGGAQVWLPGGLYAGVQGAARWWAFGDLPATTAPLDDRAVLTADAVMGAHGSRAAAWVRAGLDASGAAGPWTVSPHVHGELRTTLGGTVRPVVEIRAGWAAATDEVTATRVGGLNPYVVPVAGLAWAEVLAERYVAVRAGPEVEVPVGPARRTRWTTGLLVDAARVRTTATADGGGGADRHLLGLAARTRVESRGRFLEVALGGAPWQARPDGGLPLAGWLRLGVDWGRGLGPRTTDEAPTP